AIATTPIVSTRAFPPEIRFSGLSFAYNLAYAVFGGLTPILTGAWLQQSHMGPAYYVAGVSLLAVAVAFIPLSWKGWTGTSEQASNNAAVLKTSTIQ
ncbi:MAG: MFS transporter, partial [Providencia rustigianii]